MSEIILPKFLNIGGGKLNSIEDILKKDESIGAMECLAGNVRTTCPR